MVFLLLILISELTAINITPGTALFRSRWFEMGRVKSGFGIRVTQGTNLDYDIPETELCIRFWKHAFFIFWPTRAIRRSAGFEIISEYGFMDSFITYWNLKMHFYTTPWALESHHYQLLKYDVNTDRMIPEPSYIKDIHNYINDLRGGKDDQEYHNLEDIPCVVYRIYRVPRFLCWLPNWLVGSYATRIDFEGTLVTEDRHIFAFTTDYNEKLTFSQNIKNIQETI